jgi:hypothetical protein
MIDGGPGSRETLKRQGHPRIAHEVIFRAIDHQRNRIEVRAGGSN